ncbi:MAG: ribosomal RNA small subunit methyltransferase A [Bdellovibrionales bacterium]|nr:ribosomal RNA small subunit methyltransferase A [Bdellovibrionales bacterium]
MRTFDKQKAFGQHFLKDEVIINNIVDAGLGALARRPGHSLLEIGPGKGAITRPLLSRLPLETPFHLAERDRDLIDYWTGESRVCTFLKGDFLDQADEVLRSLGKLVVVSNLPYSAGTAIVVKLASLSDCVSEMVLMFQAEVAKRIYSGPSTPDRGSLSLFIQNEWETERLCVVPPASFQPPPRVMSEVVTLRKRPQALIPLGSALEHKAWNDLLRLAFRHRRKMIKGNFAGTVWQRALEESGVDPAKRAEGLEWSEWILLWNSGKENACNQ